MTRKSKMIGLMLAVAASVTLQAADATWYDDGTGIWDASALNWNGGTSAWTAGDTAVFSGAGGVVTVDGKIEGAGLTFNTGGYKLVSDVTSCITNSGSNVVFYVSVPEGLTVTNLANLKMEHVTFRKTGKGTLYLGGTNRFMNYWSSAVGDSRVAEGILMLMPGNTRSLGPRDFDIASGATLDLNGCRVGDTANALPIIHPAGTGVNGMGALVNTGANHVNLSFGNLNLSADALVCGPRRIDISTINMLGKNLTVSNILDQLCVNTLKRNGNETLYIANNGLYTVMSDNSLGNDVTKGQTVLLSGGRLNVWSAHTVANKVTVSGPARIQEGQNSVTAIAKFTGELVVNNSLTFAANNTSTIEMAGKLTGTGRLRLENGHLRFSTDNNAWSGQLAVADSGGTTYRYLAIGARKGTKGTLGNIKSIYGESANSRYVYERSDTYTLANCAITNGIFQVFDGGTLVFDNCAITNTYFLGAVGSFTFRNTKVESPGRNFVVGTRYDPLDRPLATNACNVVTIEDGSDITCNVLEAGNGSTITNADGSAAGVMTGIVYQTGGRVRTMGSTDPSGGTCGFHFGHWPQARAFYYLSGGTLSVENGHKLAIAVDGYGTLNQTGGEIFCKTFDLNCRTGGSGRGTYVMEGGELNVGAGGIITGNGTNPNEPYSCTLRGGTIRATADMAFRISATLNSTNAANNVAFDTAGHSLSVSNTLSGAGGLTKTGAGTMTIVPAATYTGTTRLAGGTLVFKQAYPGGALEVAAAAVQGAGTDGALLTAPSLTFTGTAKVRVTEAETLVPETYGKSKVVARLNTALAAVPALELVQSDGTPLADDGTWKLFLAEGGKALRFGPQIGTRILVK